MNTVIKLINLSVISTSFYLLSTLEAAAITIGYFNNSDYTLPTESTTLRNILNSEGNTVTDFDSLDASIWQQIADNNQVIVIPDINLLSLAPDLPSATQTVIRNYVNNGGGFLMVGEVTEVIPVFNDVFGFSFDEDFWGGSTLLTEAAQGTIFESAPSSLGSPLQTTTMALDSLPAETIVFYDNLLSSPSNEQNSTSVFVTPVGMGNIAFNGYTYTSREDDTGWAEVTTLTVEFIARQSDIQSVPESSTIMGVVMTMGMGFLSLLKKVS
ncbi:hypothetical protein [Crocosphaera sp.]|uniref:hypothetical protein n=1 Tax=Crocosphaera sp. TaxID=2729996 RepID=UPI003F27F9FB|nr:hypothetical protein [Crocosphaera sp.]